MEDSTKAQSPNHEIFSFTKVLLLVLGVFFTLAMCLHAIIDTEATANIWRSVIVVIPPMVTFLIGQYLGRNR